MDLELEPKVLLLDFVNNLPRALAKLHKQSFNPNHLTFSCSLNVIIAPSGSTSPLRDISAIGVLAALLLSISGKTVPSASLNEAIESAYNLELPWGNGDSSS